MLNQKQFQMQIMPSTSTIIQWTPSYLLRYFNCSLAQQSCLINLVSQNVSVWIIIIGQNNEFHDCCIAKIGG